MKTRNCILCISDGQSYNTDRTLKKKTLKTYYLYNGKVFFTYHPLPVRWFRTLRKTAPKGDSLIHTLTRLLVHNMTSGASAYRCSLLPDVIPRCKLTWTTLAVHLQPINLGSCPLPLWPYHRERERGRREKEERETGREESGRERKGERNGGREGVMEEREEREKQNDSERERVPSWDNAFCILLLIQFGCCFVAILS